MTDLHQAAWAMLHWLDANASAAAHPEREALRKALEQVAVTVNVTAEPLSDAELQEFAGKEAYFRADRTLATIAAERARLKYYMEFVAIVRDCPPQAIHMLSFLADATISTEPK